MEDWVSGTFAVLGTLMVLAGATLIVLRILGTISASNPLPEPDATTRRFSLRRLNPATQLITWGVVLLLVAAITVGVISFGFSVQAGTQ